jgi:hypothetical protein
VITTACSITYCNGACRGLKNKKKKRGVKKKNQSKNIILTKKQVYQILYLNQANAVALQGMSKG